MATIVRIPGSSMNLAKTELTKQYSWWKDTDDQRRPAWISYEYDLDADTTYNIGIVSVSTSGHSSNFDILSGTVNTLSNLQTGNGLRMLLLYSETNSRIKINIQATSSGSRNASGIIIAKLEKQGTN